MDILKKNTMWIAIAGLAVAGYAIYRMNKAIVKKSDGTYAFTTDEQEAKFAGKIRNNNPVA